MPDFWNRDTLRAPRDAVLWVELDGKWTMKGKLPTYFDDWFIYPPSNTTWRGRFTVLAQRVTGWREGPTQRAWI